MAELDFCTCKVALGGDLLNIHYRSKYDPVSIPEVECIVAIHGEASVTEVAYCETRESTPADEKLRLSSIYGATVVNECFQGRNPVMNMTAPDRPADPPAEEVEDEDEAEVEEVEDDDPEGETKAPVRRNRGGRPRKS